jgi:hypothetical protein
MFNFWGKPKVWEVDDALIVILVLPPTALLATQLGPDNCRQTDASVSTGRLGDNLTL